MMSEGIFRNRAQAGEVLAAYVQAQLGPAAAVVLALPRGGVPVGEEVARTLDAPMDIVAVRKLVLAEQPEVAIGAITHDYAMLDEALLSRQGVERELIDAIIAHEIEELDRQEYVFRPDHGPIDIHGRTAVIVDDGLATGCTLRAAIGATKQRRPVRIVVAVPVGSPAVCRELAREVDLLVCPLQPQRFTAVGDFYRDFRATTDDQIRECLRATEERFFASHHAHSYR
jgi:putative phosphoribosyl transferase